jgi:hypothetical protein
MIDVSNDQLIFRFPEVHRDAILGVEFLRALRTSGAARLTTRVPRLGRFPVRQVDEHANRLPAGWAGHGDVMLPIHQSESLWLNFGGCYPMAVQVGIGDRDAVTGQPFRPGLTRHPQSYVVVPEQVWLDGHVGESGAVHPFVAPPTPAGSEVALEDAAVRITLVAYPMRAASFEHVATQYQWRTHDWWTGKGELPLMGRLPYEEDAEGHLPRHTIADDPHRSEDWDLAHGMRCVVHLLTAPGWQRAMGTRPPTAAPTARDYAKAGLPWDVHFEEEPAH